MGLDQQVNDNFCTVENSICQTSIDVASNFMEDSIQELFARRDENIIVEKSMSTGNILDQIDRFFKSIIAALKRFKNEISDKVNAKIRTAEMKKAFRNFNMKAQELKRQGKKNIEMVDVWELDRILEKYWKQLSKQAKKLLNTRYKHLSAMDVDFRVFNSTMEKAEEEFDRIVNTKIKVPIDDAINFVEDCITKNEPILSSIDSYIQGIESLEHDVKALADKKEIYGVDVLPEKISIARRMINKLASFLHRTIGKRVAKIISGIVFLCA